MVKLFYFRIEIFYSFYQLYFAAESYNLTSILISNTKWQTLSDQQIKILMDSIEISWNLFIMVRIPSA